MEALQYIYTSWKNGDSLDKGYMIYSKSEGITDRECAAIKSAMQYLVPKELPFNPSPQEIEEIFPYSFAYFLLPGGRCCVARTTYLGKDYSGRFGNYIIYALVMEPGSLACRPGELFGEPYLKTAMTEAELNAPSPVPPLPPLHIKNYGSVVNDEELIFFLSGREEEFAQLITFVLAAKDMKVPFYLNDTRENLVLWAAAVQRILPPRLAASFAFNTYVGDQEGLRSPRLTGESVEFHLVGVRPDANYFNYGIEYRSSRHIVMDFQGGYMTEGIPASRFAKAVAASVVTGFEKVDRFGGFVDKTSYEGLGGGLEDAFLCYQLLERGAFRCTEDDLQAILVFGEAYCTEADKADMGNRLLVKMQQENWTVSASSFAHLWEFICRNTSFMIYTLYDLLLEEVYQLTCEAADACEGVVEFLDGLGKATPQAYGSFLEYLNSMGCVEQMILYLSGHPNLCTNGFYVNWIMDSYTFANGLNDRQPISKLLRQLLKNICQVPGGESEIVRILFRATSSRALFEAVLQILLASAQKPERLERLCREYLRQADSASEAVRFEKYLFGMTEAAPLAAQLAACKIGSAKNPEEAFWHFYSLQSDGTRQQPLGPMVTACLGSLTGQAKSQAAFRMLEEQDSRLLEDERAAGALTGALEGCDMGTLGKLGCDMLEGICRLGIRTGVDTPRIRAVYVGICLKEGNSIFSPEPVELGKTVRGADVRLSDLGRTDYEIYVRTFLREYLRAVKSSEDMALVVKTFYHRQAFDQFTGRFVDRLRMLEKKGNRQWQKLAAWACAAILTVESGTPAEEELYKALAHYLKGLSKENLADIRERICRDTSEEQCDLFFEEVMRKEKLFDRFRKKK